MGANAAREAQAVYSNLNTMNTCSPQMKGVKDIRRPVPSPRDFNAFSRSGLRERQPLPKTAVDMACQTEGWIDADMGVAQYGGAESSALLLGPDSASSGFAMPAEGKDGYNALTPEDEAATIERGDTKGKCTEEMKAWHDEWLHSVECGELDIYTCLGLSNAFTFTADTRKIIAKVIGVCVLQVVVPIILLKVELDAGFSYKPLIPGIGFRMMGCCLYLYSLYSMYNNALDECRSTLLQWAIDQNIPMGHWLPMMLGEITNVFVSLILVLTLFVIFVGVEHPADLILNAVAVNFLGAVDGEFVDDEMKQDALRNFRDVFYEYGADADENGSAVHHTCLQGFLNILLTFIVVAGLILAGVFLVAPSPEHTDTANIGKPAYPKLI